MGAIRPRGHPRPDETIVVINTGAAQKYVELMDTELPMVDPPVDYAALTS